MKVGLIVECTVQGLERMVCPKILENGAAVIALRVPGGGGPYVYDGRPYMRNGPTTIIMPQAIYERKLLERNHASNRWENQPAIGVTPDDLDRAEITRTVGEAIRRGGWKIPERGAVRTC